jgi:hypothetical protein
LSGLASRTEPVITVMKAMTRRPPRAPGGTGHRGQSQVVGQTTSSQPAHAKQADSCASFGQMLIDGAVSRFAF